MIPTISSHLRFMWHSVRSPYVNESRLLLSKAPAYSLAPLEENMSRIYNISSEPGSQTLSAIEVSYFLKDLSEQGLDVLERRVPEVLAKAKAIDAGNPLQRLVKYAIDGEYRNAQYLEPFIRVHKGRIAKTYDTLIRLLKYTKLDSIPVGTVSNSLYAAAKLNLDFSSVYESILKPVLIEKHEYLSTQGIAETIWGLNKLGIKEDEIVKKLLGIISSRDVKFIQVKLGFLNQSAYQLDTEAKSLNEVELLREVHISSTNPEIKKLIEDFLSSYKSK